MSRPLRLLMVEDSEDDAELLVRELARLDWDVDHERVETAEAMRDALERRPWDFVISDFSMPAFSALGALEVLRQSGLNLPLIVSSGTIGEELAVEALKAGAGDFFIKGKFSRLGPAIERELKEAAGRRELQRAAAERIRTMEELTLFRALVDQSHDAVVVVDPVDGRFLDVNETCYRTLGYTREEFLLLHLWDVKSTLEPTSYRPFVEQTRRSVIKYLEGVLRRKDGSTFPVEVNAKYVQLDRSYIVILARDITERKKADEARAELEEQLRHAQKMEAVGRLAGGIAHDFNNLLSVILSYAAMVSEGIDSDEPLRADVEEIRKAGLRAAELTKQLLAFSRQQILEPRVLDLNRSVADMEMMLRRLLGADIELKTVGANGLWSIKADPGQIVQIVMNLAVNARDAMPEGGNLTIETQNIELGSEYAQTHADVSVGPYVMLAASDTGIGMDKATQARIFEPFFTTKEQGKGTGLGLSTVFGIVKQSGGHIWVYSEPGEGTTFKIYFPRVGGPAEVFSSKSRPPQPARSCETILLVEDDEQLRPLAVNILRRHGYHVLEAKSGDEALLVCDQHRPAIHVMVTDIVMPKMSGRELAERLKPLRPQMKVLYMSGYTDNSILHHGVLQSGVAFLQKPITPETLTRKVREVLDE